DATIRYGHQTRGGVRCLSQTRPTFRGLEPTPWLTASCFVCPQYCWGAASSSLPSLTSSTPVEWTKTTTQSSHRNLARESLGPQFILVCLWASLQSLPDLSSWSTLSTSKGEWLSWGSGSVPCLPAWRSPLPPCASRWTGSFSSGRWMPG